ncbi:MAG: helix-turn-helix domain-containing protein [Oscillospiraceae bacterium]|nr:helix-turn-helix domain-containing protein [Oscillospiraceae bacterium]
MKLRIRDLRDDNNLTQKQISSLFKCDQSLYSKYERGERELPLDLAMKLAVYYNVSVDYIVKLTDEKKPYPRNS